jgi:hypothetical protein
MKTKTRKPRIGWNMQIIECDPGPKCFPELGWIHVTKFLVMQTTNKTRFNAIALTQLGKRIAGPSQN